MELYVGVVGTVPSVNQWETELRAVKLPFRAKRGEDDYFFKLGVAEMKLYKLFFPEDQLDTIMNVVGVGKDKTHVLKNHPILDKITTIVRKTLGLKKAPTPTSPVGHMQPCVGKSVGVVPIGYRADNFDKEGIELL